MRGSEVYKWILLLILDVGIGKKRLMLERVGLFFMKSKRKLKCYGIFTYSNL